MYILNKINPEEVFQRNYTSNVCYVSRHWKHSTLKTTNEELIGINSWSVHATATSAGGGMTLLRNICSSIDLPPPVHTLLTQNI